MTIISSSNLTIHSNTQNESIYMSINKLLTRSLHTTDNKNKLIPFVFVDSYTEIMNDFGFICCEYTYYGGKIKSTGDDVIVLLQHGMVWHPHPSLF